MSKPLLKLPRDKQVELQHSMNRPTNSPEVITPHLYISHDDIGTVLHVTPHTNNPNYRIEVTLTAQERKMLKEWL